MLGRSTGSVSERSRTILLVGAFIVQDSGWGYPSTFPGTPQGTVQADLVHSVTKDRTASSLFFGSSLSHTLQPISKQSLRRWLQCTQDARPAHLLCPNVPNQVPSVSTTLLPCVPSPAQSFPNCKLDHNARLSHSRQNLVPSFGLHYNPGHLPTIPCLFSCLRDSWPLGAGHTPPGECAINEPSG